MKTHISNLGWMIFACISWWLAVAIITACLAGCGGTLALRPDGSIEYTTPRAIVIQPDK